MTPSSVPPVLKLEYLYRKGKVPVRVRVYEPSGDGLVRIKAGGLPEISGYFLNYQGSKDQVIAGLEHLLAALKADDSHSR